MTETISIKFEGPFTLTEGDRCLFTSPYAEGSGVYLWVFKQHADDSYLIHYIGESSKFGQRQREHIYNTLGLHYGIFDPEKAKDGQCVRIWDGLWRDKSYTGIDVALSKYQEMAGSVIRYLDAIEVFFAPIEGKRKERMSVEGWIGWNLRNNHPEAKILYPDDCHIARVMCDGISAIKIECDHVIHGLDPIVYCGRT